MQEKMENVLDRQIWITKGARFNAYRRLKRKHYASIFTIAILTFYNIGLTLLPSEDIDFFIEDHFLASASVLLSIFILVLSLLEVGKGYELKADRLHQNAIELNKLYSLYSIAGQSNSETWAKKYHALIKNCPENHAPIDGKVFHAEHPHDFGLEFAVSWKKKTLFKIKKPRACWYFVRYYIETYWLYSLLVLSPAIIFFR